MSKTTNILLLIFGTCLFLFAGIYGQVLISAEGFVGFDLWAARIGCFAASATPIFFSWFGFIKQIKARK